MQRLRLSDLARIPERGFVKQTSLSILLIAQSCCYLISWSLWFSQNRGWVGRKFTLTSEVLLHLLLRDDCEEIWMRVFWSWPELPS